MNREDYTTACMQCPQTSPRPIPGPLVARLALMLFYDDGRHTERPDIAVYLVEGQVCAYANECAEHFRDLRSLLPYDITSLSEITEHAHKIAIEYFDRAAPFDATKNYIDTLAAEFDQYKETKGLADAWRKIRDKEAYEEDLETARQTDPAHYDRLLDWSEEAEKHMY